MTNLEIWPANSLVSWFFKEEGSGSFNVATPSWGEFWGEFCLVNHCEWAASERRVSGQTSGRQWWWAARVSKTWPHITTPHHTTPHYTTPHHTTLHYITLHHTTPHHTTPHHTTLHHHHATPHHTPSHHTKQITPKTTTTGTKSIGQRPKPSTGARSWTALRVVPSSVSVNYNPTPPFHNKQLTNNNNTYITSFGW